MPVTFHMCSRRCMEHIGTYIIRSTVLLFIIMNLKIFASILHMYGFHFMNNKSIVRMNVYSYLHKYMYILHMPF